MAETFITADSKKIHYWDRTIGANTVLDEFTLPGEYPLASYVVFAETITIATTDAHVLQLMAGSSLNVRIRRITLEQVANATTVAYRQFQLLRLTTAGTGGTSVTPAKFDPADAASGATGMTLPTVKGTESTVIIPFGNAMRQALSATGSVADDMMFEWYQKPGQKPIIIAAGTANGIAIKNLSATPGATITAVVEFVETSF